MFVERGTGTSYGVSDRPVSWEGAQAVGLPLRRPACSLFLNLPVNVTVEDFSWTRSVPRPLADGELEEMRRGVRVLILWEHGHHEREDDARWSETDTGNRFGAYAPE